jgi:hypothetical protein
VDAQTLMRKLGMKPGAPALGQTSGHRTLVEQHRNVGRASP